MCTLYRNTQNLIEPGWPAWAARHTRQFPLTPMGVLATEYLNMLALRISIFSRMIWLIEIDLFTSQTFWSFRTNLFTSQMFRSFRNNFFSSRMIWSFEIDFFISQTFWSFRIIFFSDQMFWSFRIYNFLCVSETMCWYQIFNGILWKI